MSISSQCPAWARGEEEYTYNKNEWGGDLIPLSPPGYLGPAKDADYDTQRTAALSTACAWLAACNTLATTEAKEQCRSNCPRAVGMSHNESGWHPHAQAEDGWGRGLFQWGGPAAPACVHGFTGQACGLPYNGNTLDPHDGGGLDATVSDCTAYDPLKNIAEILSVTNNGNHWRPNGNQWNACQSTSDGLGRIKQWDQLNTTDTGNLAVNVCQAAAGGDVSYTDDDYSRCTIGDAVDAIKHPTDICSACTSPDSDGDNRDYCDCKSCTQCYSTITDRKCCKPFVSNAQPYCNGETCFADAQSCTLRSV